MPQESSRKQKIYIENQLVRIQILKKRRHQLSESRKKQNLSRNKRSMFNKHILEKVNDE